MNSGGGAVSQGAGSGVAPCSWEVEEERKLQVLVQYFDTVSSHSWAIPCQITEKKNGQNSFGVFFTILSKYYVKLDIWNKI